MIECVLDRIDTRVKFLKKIFGNSFLKRSDKDPTFLKAVKNEVSPSLGLLRLEQ